MAANAQGINEAAVEMERILRQLQSPDDSARNQAEQAFTASKQQASTCILALSTLATRSDAVVVRDTAAVLLRRSATELWGQMDATSKALVKEQLIEGIRRESRREPRKKLCDTISAVGGTEADVNDLIPFLFKMSTSEQAHERESSLFIFAQLTDFVSKMEPFLGQLYTICEAGLQDPDVFIEIEALRATCSILSTFDAEVSRAFGELIPLMMRPVSATLNNDDMLNSKVCIELLIEAMESQPRRWRRHLQPVSELMLQVATAERLEDDTRQLGMEFLVSAAEQLPGACRKMPNFVERVFPAALNMMLEVEDDPEWFDRDDTDDDDDEYTNHGLGKEALDRLAIRLGGKTILPVAFTFITKYLDNTESWQHRHAALLAISQIGEGCQAQILEQLGFVARMALSHFQDPHQRVRWAAVHCIGQMCTDFAPTIQETLHQEIMAGLIAVMDDATQPRVQSHAAASIINFCEEADAEVIQLYVDQLLRRLMTLLQSPRNLIQEQAVTAVASVADSAGVKFQPYYDSFMPNLKKVLHELAAGQKSLSKLRGKVMECISMIGYAVGRDMFKKDAEDVMNMLLQTQKATLDPDDLQSSYLMQAYARICRCLKEEFIPYLQFVMPGLLEAASTEPQMEVLSALDDEDDDEGMESIVVGDTRIGIRTSALEDKATACAMITCFVSELKGGFVQYVDPVAKLMVPLLGFYYHDECRISAAQCLPDLLVCLAMQGEQAATQYHQLLNYIFPELLKAIPREMDVEVMVVMVQSLAEIVGAQTVQDPNLLKSCADCLLRVVNERSKRILERRNEALEEEYDADDEQELVLAEENDNKLLECVADVIVAVLKSGNEVFVQVFEHPEGQSLGQMFSAMLHPDRDAVDRRIALCVFDDIIEFGGEYGVRCIETLLPAMLAYVTDVNAEVKQAAAYGIGIAAERGGEVFARCGGGRISGPLEAVLRVPDARNDENEMATDNAISAIAKILQYQPNCLEAPDNFTQALLTYLPMKSDLTEAVSVHQRLVELVESGNMTILGNNFVNLGHILRIFADVMDTNLMSKDYTVRAAVVLKNMQQQLPGETLQQASSGLNEQQRAKIQAAVL